MASLNAKALVEQLEQYKQRAHKAEKQVQVAGAGSFDPYKYKSGGDSGSGSSGTAAKEVEEQCSIVIRKSPYFKEGFKSALIAAMTNIIRNSQDQLFLETANLVTNKPPGTVIPKVQLRNNLTQFIFGDDKGRILRTKVRDAGKFAHVIFLAIITHKTLLDNKKTQEATFQAISEMAGNAGAQGFLSKFKGQQNCRSVRAPGSLFKRNRECDQESWAKIYLVFSEQSLKRVCEILAVGEDA